MHEIHRFFMKQQPVDNQIFPHFVNNLYAKQCIFLGAMKLSLFPCIPSETEARALVLLFSL